MLEKRQPHQRVGAERQRHGWAMGAPRRRWELGEREGSAGRIHGSFTSEDPRGDLSGMEDAGTATAASNRRLRHMGWERSSTGVRGN